MEEEEVAVREAAVVVIVRLPTTGARVAVVRL